MATLDDSWFDDSPPRAGSGSIKWDRNQKQFGRNDLIPLWIADMDFAIAPAITEAIQARSQHPVYGYSFRRKSFIQSIKNWLESRFDWQVSASSLLFYPPGTVAAVNMLVRLLTGINDGVVVLTPSYPPLMNVVVQNQRELLNCELQVEEGEYRIDYQRLEECLISARLMILCSPHNPTGRVWRKDELLEIARLCQKHNVIVVSDEVHADLVFPEFEHLHFNHIDKECRPPAITIISSCKTFNLAAMSQSTLICDDESLKSKIQHEINTSQLNLDNIFSAVATQAAYSHGEPWLDALIPYVKRNRDWLAEFLQEHLPQVYLFRPQGTYLAWLDFTKTEASHEDLQKTLIEKAGVGLYDGRKFAGNSDRFFRVNLACRRAILEKAFQQIRAALG